MDCQQARESILESLVEPLGAAERQAVELHTTTCETCRSFAEIQRTLDARLAAALPAAVLSAGFRKSLKSRMRRDPGSAWPDFLPDLAHLAGCSVATGVSVFLLPLPAGSVILAGAAFTGLTFFLQAVVRASLDGLEGDA
jgi:anti-sigma factor RsiW